MKLIEQYISTNYSDIHTRAFRYLKTVGIGNADSVETKCVMFPNEARKILYDLQFRGFIGCRYGSKEGKEGVSDPIYFFNFEMAR